MNSQQTLGLILTLLGAFVEGCGHSPAPHSAPSPSPESEPASASVGDQKEVATAPPAAPVHALLSKHDGSLWSQDVHGHVPVMLSPASAFPCKEQAPSNEIKSNNYNESKGRHYDGRLELLWEACDDDTLWVMDLREQEKKFIDVAVGVSEPWLVQASGSNFPEIPPYLGDSITIRIVASAEPFATADGGWNSEGEEVASVDEKVALTANGKSWLEAQADRSAHRDYSVATPTALEVSNTVDALADAGDASCGQAMPLGDSKTIFIVCHHTVDTPEHGDVSEYALFDSERKKFAHLSDLASTGEFTWGPYNDSEMTYLPVVFNTKGSHLLAGGAVCTTSGACVEFDDAYALGFLGGERHHGE